MAKKRLRIRHSDLIFQESSSGRSNWHIRRLQKILPPRRSWLPESRREGRPFRRRSKRAEGDIGRRVRFPEGEEGTYYAHEHVIVAVQKDREGNFAYRVQLAENLEGLGKAKEDLGRVAPLEVEFVGDKESEKGSE